MIKEYTFITDIGHAWLKVPFTELVALGIENDISAYSYHKEGMTYLEEDCDAYRFIKASQKIGNTIRFKELIVNRESKIRTYNSYSNLLI